MGSTTPDLLKALARICADSWCRREAGSVPDWPDVQSVFLRVLAVEIGRYADDHVFAEDDRLKTSGLKLHASQDYRFLEELLIMSKSVRGMRPSWLVSNMPTNSSPSTIRLALPRHVLPLFSRLL